MIIVLREEMKNSQLEIKKKTTENNWEKSINPLNNITKTKKRQADGGKYSRPKNKNTLKNTNKENSGNVRFE